MNVAGYPLFRRTLLDLTGIDLDCYKGTQMERRLQTIMKRSGCEDLASYARLLATNPAQLKIFKDFLTINVSEFLRNPDKFEELKRSILPGLLKGRASLRIWSAGCSNGSEPYSIAMLLAELDPGRPHTILATDLDEEILKVAAAGVYADRDIKSVTPERRQRFMTREGDRFAIKPELKSYITFGRHNLLRDEFPANLDLILCRNVVIYFTEEAKDQLYRRFHAALRPDGVLFVGGTESLLRAREMGYATVAPFFYRAEKSVPTAKV